MGDDYEVEVVAPRGQMLTFDDFTVKDTSLAVLGGGKQYAAADITNHSAAIFPSLALAEMQMKPVLRWNGAPAVGQQRGLMLKFFPRVVLWNPYNVTLKSKGYYVKMSYPWRARIQFAGCIPRPANWGGYIDVAFDGGPGSFAGSFKNPVHEAVFYVEPTEIKPGESLMFVPKANTEWHPSSHPRD